MATNSSIPWQGIGCVGGLFFFCILGLAFPPAPKPTPQPEQGKKEQPKEQAPTPPVDSFKPNLDVGATVLVDQEIEVTVGRTVKVAPVQFRVPGKAEYSEDSYLQIEIEYVNVSPKFIRAIPWSNQRGIMSPHPATLSCDKGDYYANIHFRDKAIVGTMLGVGEPRSTLPLNVKQRMVDLLVFQKPAEEVKYLNLTLPAKALGKNTSFWTAMEDIKVRIPIEAIDRK